MKQLCSPGITTPSDAVVNVSTVKHRSPFRYPGGKTWLVPRIRQWLVSLPAAQRRVFVEPFAGGAIAGLTTAFEQLAEQIVLVELDEQVAAVWETIINAGEGDRLAQRIESFAFSSETVAQLLDQDFAALTLSERAFQTIVSNRVNRGGILAPGAGRIKSGENGKGLASRWYPETLARRIREIDAIRDRLTFVKGDGMTVMARYADRQEAIFFIDPPYTAAGKKAGRRLYTCSDLDHDALFDCAARLAGDLLLTYNADDAIRQIAAQHGFDSEPVAMKNTHHARLTELVIGRDLGWLRRSKKA